MDPGKPRREYLGLQRPARTTLLTVRGRERRAQASGKRGWQPGASASPGPRRNPPAVRRRPAGKRAGGNAREEAKGVGREGETEGRRVRQPRPGSSPPPQSEPKMAAGAAAAAAAAALGREGASERAKGALCPPPRLPLLPPRALPAVPPLTRLRTRSAHARPQASECVWTGREMRPPAAASRRPEPATPTRSLRGARSRAPGARSALTRTFGGASPNLLRLLHLLLLLGSPPSLPRPHGYQRQPRPPPPPSPPPLERAPPTIPPAGRSIARGCRGKGEEAWPRRVRLATATGLAGVASDETWAPTSWNRPPPCRGLLPASGRRAGGAVPLRWAVVGAVATARWVASCHTPGVGFTVAGREPRIRLLALCAGHRSGRPGGGLDGEGTEPHRGCGDGGIGACTRTAPRLEVRPAE